MQTQPTRVLFAFPREAFLRNYEKSYVTMVTDELRRNADKTKFVIADVPARADIIILIQSAEYKTVEYIRMLENDPLVRNHAERVYVIDYDDHPNGMLAGLYTSIEPPFLDPELHRSWPILFMNNPLIYDLTPSEIAPKNPSCLFSFAGADSHPLRKRLFDLFAKPSPQYRVEEINKWYNHNDEDRRRFVKLALDSVFCLCPRGYASYTNRIPEIMAMGRAPVIIADDWIPFSFVENVPYYIRVAEKDMEHLPDILNSRRAEAEDCGRNARVLWEKYCSFNRRVVAAVEAIAQLAARPGSHQSYADYRALWHSREFLLRCSWTFRQRTMLRLKQHLRKMFS